MVILPDGRAVAGYGQLARVLSALDPARQISRRQVHTWAARADRNGFPEPVPAELLAGTGARGRHYDVAACTAWLATYRPSPGGAPTGNHNALRHGAYAGQEAAKAARGYVRPRTLRALAAEAEPGTLQIVDAADALDDVASHLTAGPAAGVLADLAQAFRSRPVAS